MSHCFVDSSNPEAIRSMCLKTGQRQNYHEELKELNQKNLDPFLWMSGKIISVNFSTDHKYLLQHCRRLIDAKQVAIPRHLDRLILSLQTAVAYDDILSKQETIADDILDSLRLALKYYNIEDDYDYDAAVFEWKRPRGWEGGAEKK